MEVVCDDNLRIWSLNFDITGSKNDRNIMNYRKLFNDIRNISWPPILPEFHLEGYVVSKYCELADGIYAKYLLFALPHSDPRTKKEKNYVFQYSSGRKYVERVLGTVFRQFRIIYNKCRLQVIEEIEQS